MKCCVCDKPLTDDTALPLPLPGDELVCVQCYVKLLGGILRPPPRVPRTDPRLN